MYIKVYHSFGSQHNAIVNGHVLQSEPMQFLKRKTWLWTNINALVRLFNMNTIPNVPLVLEVFGNTFYTTSDENGYFEFEFDPQNNIPAGWHAIKISHQHQPNLYNEGEIFVPYASSQAIISDIDDTVLKSYSASFIRKIYELLSKNPHERRLFDHTVEWYRELAESHPPGSETHPFFYVSSSEWNLYDYLNTIFELNGLPKGIFLLNHIKSIKQFFKTGKTGHEGKLERIKSLIKAFPEQEFILIGDNTQKDPYIYASIAKAYPDSVIAIFIRNKRPKNQKATQELLASLNQYHINTCLFDTTIEAMKRSRELGYIQ
ncbi:MAG: App1 family protein [Weeksellaceae bacterium]